MDDRCDLTSSYIDRTGAALPHSAGGGRRQPAAPPPAGPSPGGPPSVYFQDRRAHPSAANRGLQGQLERALLLERRLEAPRRAESRLPLGRRTQRPALEGLRSCETQDGGPATEGDYRREPERCQPAAQAGEGLLARIAVTSHR